MLKRCDLLCLWQTGNSIFKMLQYSDGILYTIVLSILRYVKRVSSLLSVDDVILKYGQLVHVL